MKTKFIVASSIGLLWITSMILWATTFASNTGTNKAGGYGSWAKMMGNRGNMMKNFTNTGEAQAFKTALENAITNKDFAAFQAVHTKYGITTNVTQDQFNEMIAVKTEMDALHKKITEALKNGDYATWKILNKDTPLLSKIDTEAKFQKLAELESYREKMDAIRTELGLEWPQWEGMGMWKWFMDAGQKWEMGMGRWMERWMHIWNGGWTNQ